MDVSPVARVSSKRTDGVPWLQTSIRRHRLDGAPKWEFRVVSLNKWSASASHYKSQVPHTPELAGRFISLIFLQSFPALNVSAEFFVSAQHSPDDASVLVGNGDDCTVHAPSFSQRIYPLAERVCLSSCDTNNRSGAMDQKRSQMFVTPLADPHQNAFVSTGALPGDEAHPGRHMPAVLKFSTVADCRNNSSRRFWAHTTDTCDPPAIRIRSEDSIYAPVKRLNPGIKLSHKVEQITNDFARHWA